MNRRQDRGAYFHCGDFIHTGLVAVYRASQLLYNHLCNRLLLSSEHPSRAIDSSVCCDWIAAKSFGRINLLVTWMGGMFRFLSVLFCSNKRWFYTHKVIAWKVLEQKRNAIWHWSISILANLNREVLCKLFSIWSEFIGRYDFTSVCKRKRGSQNQKNWAQNWLQSWATTYEQAGNRLVKQKMWLIFK